MILSSSSSRLHSLEIFLSDIINTIYYLYVLLFSLSHLIFVLSLPIIFILLFYYLHSRVLRPLDSRQAYCAKMQAAIVPQFIILGCPSTRACPNRIIIEFRIIFVGATVWPLVNNVMRFFWRLMKVNSCYGPQNPL